MKITLDNIHQVDFTGLALTFDTRISKISTAGKLHKMDCSMVRASKHVSMDAGVDFDTKDLLEREFGVRLCKCAKDHFKK